MEFVCNLNKTEEFDCYKIHHKSRYTTRTLEGIYQQTTLLPKKATPGKSVNFLGISVRSDCVY